MLVIFSLLLYHCAKSCVKIFEGSLLSLTRFFADFGQAFSVKYL
jgi:hypothetical protein